MHGYGSHGSKSRAGRAMALIVLVAAAAALTGCYGRFPLTRAVYGFNGEIGRVVGGDATQRRIVQSAVFWALVIFPVYELTTLGDAVILNVIEFRTGESVDLSAIDEISGNKITMRSSPGGSEALLTVWRGGEVVLERRLIRLSDSTLEVLDENGAPIARLERSGRDVSVVSRERRTDR